MLTLLFENQIHKRPKSRDIKQRKPLLSPQKSTHIEAAWATFKEKQKNFKKYEEPNNII